MFIIRQAQKEALAAAMRADFEETMAAHLRRCFPEWSADIKPKEMLSFVHLGIKRATRYGLQTELEIARYLHVMQALGQDFDESPAMPWARELLMRKIPPQEKLDLLRDAVLYQLEARRIFDAS